MKMKCLKLAVLVACTWLSTGVQADEARGCPQLDRQVLESKAAPYQALIQAAAKKYAVSPALVRAIMASGSCFTEMAESSTTGAAGLMQLHPLTASRFGAFETFDPAENIDAATRYLSYLSKRYSGRMAHVMVAYLGNTGRLGEEMQAPPEFSTLHNHANQVLDLWLKLENNRKAVKQAQAMLKKWAKSAQSYQTALQEVPAQLKIKPAKPHWAALFYKRSPDARSCGQFSAKTLAQKAGPYEDIIQKASKRYGVNAALIKSVIASESCYREMVVSCKGASGLMQLMPETAAELGVFDIFDPQENINAGTRYLAFLLRYYGGSVTHTIAAYNAGPGRIIQNQPVTISFAETRQYIHNVLGAMNKLETGKQAREKVQVLLASWQEADRVYQAALLGLTPPVQPQVVPALLEGQSPLADGMPDAVEPPSVAGATGSALPADVLVPPVAGDIEPAPEAVAPQAMLAPTVLDETSEMPQVLAPIPAPALAHSVPPATKPVPGSDVVRVKRVLVTTELPADYDASVADRAPRAADTRVLQDIPAPLNEAEIMQPQAVAPAARPALQACDQVSPVVLEQTRQQGRGRYTAFVYPAQEGESLQVVADRLGVAVDDIARLNRLRLDSLPAPGRLLKVDECSR